ncbi:hypothetical protein JCM24511_03590 [Saitozyma sp. JCM 24511]|nr:hypothetical protein JCM24511_03590 [Saitozyma sp. JCM 24511]
MSFLLTRLFPLALLLTLVAGATAPTGWTYEGCLYDNKSNRALNSTFYALNTMTNEICRAYCGSYGFTYAGMVRIADAHALEVGWQCFCGSSFLYYTVQSESNCNTSCYGDSTELCGGSGYMTLFLLSFDNSATGAATAGTTSTTSAAAAAAASSSSSDTAALASATAITAATTFGVSSSRGAQSTSSIVSGTASSGSVASSSTQSGSGTTAANATSVSFGVLSGASGTTPSSTSGTIGKVAMPTTNSSGIITAGQSSATPNFRNAAQAVVLARLNGPGSILAVTMTAAIASLWGFASSL